MLLVHGLELYTQKAFGEGSRVHLGLGFPANYEAMQFH